MEIKRDRYLKQLIESRKNGFIKVNPQMWQVIFAKRLVLSLLIR